MRQKKAVTKELKDRYQRASKKEKTMMLNEFIRLTGYNRCYACQIQEELRGSGLAMTHFIFPLDFFNVSGDGSLSHFKNIYLPY